MFDSFKGNKLVVLIMVAMAFFLIIIVYNSATTIDIDVFIGGTTAINSSIQRSNIATNDINVTGSDVLYHVGFDLTLYMPMHSSEDEYLKAVFIPSLLLFWPRKMWVNSNITLLFVLDDEQEKEHEYGDGLYKEYYNIIKDVTGWNLKYYMNLNRTLKEWMVLIDNNIICLLRINIQIQNGLDILTLMHYFKQLLHQ